MQVIMNEEKYVEILKGNLKQLLLDELIFQHDSDTKHTSLLVTKYFQMTNVSVIKWLAQALI